MNQHFFSFLFLCCCAFQLLSADQEIVGYWKTIDEKTSKPQSLVAIYENAGHYYGRIIATYDENGRMEEKLGSAKVKAPGVIGEPTYVGLDFIWDLEKEGDTYTDGRIMDPEAGKVYDAELWVENGKLKVRGKIWIFGRTQTWLPAGDADFPQGFPKPPLDKMIPNIRQVKSN
jgi:uncharacterized protein (DUF2147 family)